MLTVLFWIIPFPFLRVFSGAELAFTICVLVIGVTLFTYAHICHKKYPRRLAVSATKQPARDIRKQLYLLFGRLSIISYEIKRV